MLSLCMIVRNEEANLPRVLGSVQGLVDEMVIVDTGSTDRTIDVAKSWGARVDQIEWRDDFAAARNHSLSLAKGDWILVLDGDDEFEREDIPLVHPLLQGTAATGIGVRVTVQVPGSPPFVVVRLIFFRNRADLRYVFRVHEEMRVPSAQVEPSPLRVRHHGYTEASMPEKLARNERLLRKMQADADPEARVAGHYYLGRELAIRGRFQEALEECRIAAYSGVESVYRLYAAFALAQLSALQHDWEAAFALFHALRKDHPGTVEIELALAETLLDRGRVDEARVHFRLSQSARRRFLPLVGGAWEIRTRRRLESCLC